ncbi:MAG: GNAT family N-acetyltransferase, partial [Burkholderiaceae bacterium]|nr:GNAT family N-acetyltransferase [Burkholderiaceae bacterium]
WTAARSRRPDEPRLTTSHPGATSATTEGTQLTESSGQQQLLRNTPLFREDLPFTARSAAAPAAGAPPARTAYAVSRCGNTSQFEALGAEWNALLERAHHQSVFLKHQWMSAWWERIGAGSRDLFVLLARDGHGRLVGILPLCRQTHGRGLFARRALHFLGSWPEAPEHLDAIVDATGAAGIVEALVAALGGMRGEFDAIELLDLTEKSLLQPALARLAAAAGYACRTRAWQVCPYIGLAGTYDKYLMTLTQKHRYKVRLFGKRLAAAHKVEMEVATEPAQVGAALEEMFRLHAMRWTLKTDDVSGFDDPAVHAFHRLAAEKLAADGAIRIFLLRCDGKAVAACYCLVQGGRMYFFQPGFDPEFRKLHVGKVLLGRVIERCYEERLVEFDFLRGTEDYKFDWTERTRPTLACDVALTARARVAHALAEAQRQGHARWMEHRGRLVARVKAHPTGAKLLAALKKRRGGMAAPEPAED